MVMVLVLVMVMVVVPAPVMLERWLCQHSTDASGCSHSSDSFSDISASRLTAD